MKVQKTKLMSLIDSYPNLTIVIKTPKHLKYFTNKNVLEYKVLEHFKLIKNYYKLYIRAFNENNDSFTRSLIIRNKDISFKGNKIKIKISGIKAKVIFILK